ncbi:prenyltransferase/squalene oxidase repeat-containing protein [Planctomycetota bacterium]
MISPENHFLVEKYRDGALSKREAKKLGKILSADDSTAEEVIDEIEFIGLLSEALDPIEDQAFARSFFEQLSAQDESRDFREEFNKRLEQSLAQGIPSFAPAKRTRKYIRFLLTPFAAFIMIAAGVFNAAKTGIMNIRANIRHTSWWFISLAFHSACLVITALLVIFIPQKPEEDTVISMNIQAVHGQGYSRVSKMGIKERELKEFDHGLNTDLSDPIKEELYELTMPEDIERAHIPEHLREFVPMAGLNGKAWVEKISFIDDIGAVFKNRTGINRKNSILHFGGGAATESAVLAALRWFKRHQAPDGSWSYEDYSGQCKVAPACNTVDVKDYQWMAEKRTNSGTAFALLCFLGAGHTQNRGKFRQQIADGLSFLKQAQAQDGSFAQNNYTHAVAAMALAEAYGMTKAASLREPAEKAVKVCLNRQTKEFGWDYSSASTRSDTSVTGWNVMALKSAKSAGLEIGDAFSRITSHLKHVTPEIKGSRSHPVLANHVWYQYIKGQAQGSGHSNSRLTAIGLLARVFTGEDAKGLILRAHARKLLEELPSTDKPDYYRTYYASLAMFQMGGTYWKKWNETMKKVLCGTQCKGGCADGSWDPEGYIGGRMGRLFTTAMGCLSLEVYYRYLPVMPHKNIGDK